MATPDGAHIPIEQRAESKYFISPVSKPRRPVRVPGVRPSMSPPPKLIDAIVTERGVVLAPTREKMALLMRA